MFPYYQDVHVIFQTKHFCSDIRYEKSVEYTYYLIVIQILSISKKEFPSSKNNRLIFLKIIAYLCCMLKIYK